MGSNHVACVSIFAKSKNARGYNQRVCNGTRYLNMGIRGLSPSLLSHKSTPTLIKVHNSVDVEGTNLGASKKNHPATIDEKRTFFVFAATHGLSESKFPYLFHPWPPIAQETLLLIQSDLLSRNVGTMVHQKATLVYWEWKQSSSPYNDSLYRHRISSFVFFQ